MAALLKTQITKQFDLFQGDCMELLRTIPDQSVDMVLCDLPYGTTQNKWDSVLPLADLWSEYRRIAKPSAAIVLTAAQPFTSALVISNTDWFTQHLVWRKNVASNFLNANRQHLMRHEDIVVFSAKQPTFNKQVTAGKPYKAKRSGRDDTGDNYGAIAVRTDTTNEGTRNPISVLDFDRETGHHPTQKPVALMEYLIKTYTNEGDTVLDNTMGSGTTGVACMNTGRKFIGMERDPAYFAIAQQRINEAAFGDLC
jgi:site-specific DNA-methyltransferase (adenine-specific)